MLDISFVRAHMPVIKMACKRRGLNIDVQKIIDLDSKRKRLFFLIEENKKEFLKLKESKEYYDEEDYESEKKNRISVLKKSQEELKKTMHDLKKNMMLLPNITDMQVPLGESIDQAIVVKKSIIKPENIDREDYIPQRAMDYFEKRSLIESGKIKFISDKNGFLMHPVASKIYIASWNKFFNFFSMHNFLPFSAPQYLNQKFSHIFDFKSEEENSKSALVLTSFFSNRFLNFNEKQTPKKFFSFRQESRKDFFDDFVFSALLITSVNQIEVDKEIDKIQNNFAHFLDLLGVAYKIVILPISMLKKGDNKRIAIMAYFPAEKKYRIIWEIAYTRDYYTRRLSIRYKEEISIENRDGENKKKKEKINFPYMIYTSELNSHDIFELITQNSQKKNGKMELPKGL